MPSDYDDELLREGILHFKAAEFQLAQRYFERALDVTDDYNTRASANYYLSLLTDDPAKKREYLEETLVIDPIHPEARRELAILDGRLKSEDIFNADQVPPPPVEKVEPRVEKFNCPKCGGRMVFAPDGKSLVCEFCSRSQALGGQRLPDQDFFAAMATMKGHSVPTSMQLFHCEGCGAEYILAPEELSVTCSYCGSVHVITQDREVVAPDTIIPVSIDREEAGRIFSGWIDANKVKLVRPDDQPRPLYMPVWAFDIIGNVPWSGLVHKDKQKIPVSGEKSLLYHDIVVPATKKLPALLPAVFQGFTISNSVPYEPGYLAGWPAEVHSITLSEAALEARRIAVVRLRAEIVSDLPHVMDLRYPTSAISADRFKLVLVPVWLSVVLQEGKLTPVVINGISGAVTTEVRSRGIFDRLLGNR